MVRFRPVLRWLDVLIAAVLTVAGQLEVWSGLVLGGPRPAVAVVSAVGTLALAFRRRAPTAVLIVACGAATVQAALGVDSNSAFVPLLAAFVAIGSAGYYARRPVIALVVAILVVWPGVLLDSTGIPWSDLLYAVVLIVLAWSVGRAAAVGALRAQLAEERAAAAIAEERVHIARELHDIVAHSVSVMTLHAGGVRRLLRSDQVEERDALGVVEQAGRQAMAELARVLGMLRSPAEERYEARPRLARAEELLEPARAAGLSARLRVQGEPCQLPASVDLSVYRILQEALTNVLKHADATQVDATISYGDGAIRLDVTDDGAARGGPRRANGHGLLGLRERAVLYGGTLDAGPLPGRGFRVAAVVPLPEAER